MGKVMEKIENLYLYDKDGDAYIFEVYPAVAVFLEIPGVYGFVKRTTNQQGVSDDIILYIGKTNSLKNRLRNSHEKLCDAELMGMTHICVMEVLDEDHRRSIEIALIDAYNPTLNTNKS